MYVYFKGRRCLRRMSLALIVTWWPGSFLANVIRVEHTHSSPTEPRLFYTQTFILKAGFLMESEYNKQD